MDNCNRELEKLNELRIWLMEWYSDGYLQSHKEMTKELFAEWVKFAERNVIDTLSSDEKMAMTCLFNDIMCIYGEENRRSDKLQGDSVEEYKSKVCG